MTELPIVVETSAWLVASFGVLLIVISLVLARGFILDPPASIDGFGSFVLLCFSLLFIFGLGCAMAVQSIHWQFSIEEKGVVLRAPFDLLRPSEEIAWSDVERIFIAESSYRGGATFYLRVVGKHGKSIELAGVDQFPAQFGPLLQKVVVERVPHAKDIQRIAEDAHYARTHSTALLASGYTVRNASGEFLK